MADGQSFSYSGLFSKNAPAGRPGAFAKRGKYDFAVAYPDPKSIPLEGLMAGLKEALEEEGEDLALYSDQAGYPPLREFIAQKLSTERNIHITPDDLILGDGSGQPIHMVCEALLNKGDVVLTDDFVYSGTLNQLRRFGTDIRGIETDENGMLPESVEQNIKNAQAEGKAVKFIYLIPTFQNPQGWTLSFERREAILALSQKYGIPILEDDCYVDLRYDGDSVPSLHAMDDSGSVIYVGSFSKIIAPGMRIGYITAPPEMLNVARAVKSGSFVNMFAAYAVHRYSTGHLSAHIEEINEVQRVKRDAMLSALGENFGSSATWSSPEGGLFIWLQLQEEADVLAVRDQILDEFDVGFQSGPLFAPDGVSGKNCARLCFGYNSPEDIRQGVARLAEGFDKKGLLN